MAPGLGARRARHHQRKQPEEDVGDVHRDLPRHGTRTRGTPGALHRRLKTRPDHPTLRCGLVLEELASHRLVVPVLLPGERGDARHDDGRSQPRHHHGEVELDEHVVQPDEPGDEEGEGDGRHREVGGDDRSLPLTVEPPLVLLVGDEHAQRGRAHPGSGGIDGAAPGKSEDSTEGRADYGADELHEPELHQEGQEDQGEEEEGEEDRDEVVEDDLTGGRAYEEVRAHTQEGHDAEGRPDEAEQEPPPSHVEDGRPRFGPGPGRIQEPGQRCDEDRHAEHDDPEGSSRRAQEGLEAVGQEPDPDGHRLAEGERHQEHGRPHHRGDEKPEHGAQLQRRLGRGRRLLHGAAPKARGPGVSRRRSCGCSPTPGTPAAPPWRGRAGPAGPDRWPCRPWSGPSGSRP